MALGTVQWGKIHVDFMNKGHRSVSDNSPSQIEG